MALIQDRQVADSCPWMSMAIKIATTSTFEVAEGIYIARFEQGATVINLQSGQRLGGHEPFLRGPDSRSVRTRIRAGSSLPNRPETSRFQTRRSIQRPIARGVDCGPTAGGATRRRNRALCTLSANFVDVIRAQARRVIPFQPPGLARSRRTSAGGGPTDTGLIAGNADGHREATRGQAVPVVLKSLPVRRPDPISPACSSPVCRGRPGP
jgi:hypothetical protein